MEAEVQCIVLNGASLNIKTIEIDSDTGCELQFEANIDECNSNRNEFLKLVWYNTETKCFSFKGVSKNDGTMGEPVTTHLTPYYYVDYIPDDFSQAKFRVIWGFLIALHILFDILIFLSLVACCFRHKSDF